MEGLFGGQSSEPESVFCSNPDEKLAFGTSWTTAGFLREFGSLKMLEQEAAERGGAEHKKEEGKCKAVENGAADREARMPNDAIAIAFFNDWHAEWYRRSGGI